MDNNLPFVTLNLDEPRKFRLTLNGILELKDKHGIDLANPDSEGFDEKTRDLKFIRTLVWLGLRTYAPDLTEENVGDMLDLSNLLSILGQLGFTDSGKNVLGAAIPPKRKTPKSGTGTPPSRRPSGSGSHQKSITT